MLDKNKKNNLKDLSPELSAFFGGFFGGDLCPLEITCQEEYLLQLARQFNWEGKGTEEEPIIIASSEGLAKEFRILQSNIYIRFKDCKFDIIWLRECQNIRFENISFKKLILEKNSNIKFFECDIPFLSLSDSQDNYFERCTIESTYSVRSNVNVFRNCSFPEDMIKILKKGTFLPVLKYIYLLTLVLGSGFFYFLISSGFSFTLDSAPVLIAFGGGFVMSLLLSIIGFFGKAPSTNIIIVDNDYKE